MTSQKGAPVLGVKRGITWIASMQSEGKPLHALPSWPGCAQWLRGWSNALCQQNMCAQRDKSWPPAWRRCYSSALFLGNFLPIRTFYPGGLWRHNNNGYIRAHPSITFCNFCPIRNAYPGKRDVIMQTHLLGYSSLFYVHNASFLLNSHCYSHVSWVLSLKCLENRKTADFSRDCGKPGRKILDGFVASAQVRNLYCEMQIHTPMSQVMLYFCTYSRIPTFWHFLEISKTVFLKIFIIDQSQSIM